MGDVITDTGFVPNQPRRSYSKRLSRTLRDNMTEPEVLLWSFLRNRALGAKFRRQVPIGSYIVDFACFSHRLVIEVDGDHHDPAKDAIRDGRIVALGWRVERFWAADVFNDLDAVLSCIERLLSSPP